MSSDSRKRAGRDGRSVAAVAVVLILTGLIYAPMLANEFVGIDDDVYITANPLLADFSTTNLIRILTQEYAEFYHPLTLLSLALDHAIWGNRPLGYHLTDFVLHLLNTVLVFYLTLGIVRIAASKAGEAGNLSEADRADSQANSIGLPPAALQNVARVAAVVTALLFALHPLHVESVAWAAQRKDLLCSFFVLLALTFYLRHATQTGAGRTAWRLALAAYVLALCSKSMAVTLPFLLLLLDWYPLRRIQGLPRRGMPAAERAAWMDKLPFLGLALAFALVTIAAQWQGGSLRSTREIPLSLRPWIVAYSYFFYLWKAVWPTDLTLLYPLAEQVKPDRPAIWFMLAAVVALTVAAWFQRRRRPAFTAAWAWYLVALAPVSGLLAFGAQSVADRYSYLTLLGPFVLAGAVAGRVNAMGDRGLRPAMRMAVGLATAFAIVVLSVLTSRQIDTWTNGLSLWRHHLAIFPTHARAQFNLACVYQSMGRARSAMIEYNKLLGLDPDSFEGHLNVGALLIDRGDPEPALEHVEKALARQPHHPGALNLLGQALLRLDRPEEALERLRESVLRDPNSAAARANFGEACAATSHPALAVFHCQAALKCDPAMPGAYETLGLAYLALREPAKARAALERALALAPRSSRALIAMARVEAAEQHPVQALNRLTQAARHEPENAAIHVEIARIMRAQGAHGLAESSLRRAVEIDPYNFDGQYQLGALLEARKQYADALDAMTRAWVALQYDEKPVPPELDEALRRLDAKVKEQNPG
jgi:tetratricopeptide (TPR) repeat protein